MNKDHKRLIRETKRQIKKDGNRSRRRFFQRQLEKDPEGAHWDEYNFNYNSSTHFNGMDHDATRNRNEYEQEMYGQDNEEEREAF